MSESLDYCQAFLFLHNPNKINMKKLIIIGGVGLLGLTAWYLYTKNKEKKTANVPAPNNNGEKPTAQNLDTTTQTTDHPPTESEVVDQLTSTLKADPVFQSKAFPTDFLSNVQVQLDDYNAGKPGRFNAADAYKGYGKVGAFMAVSDAWQSSLGYGEDTHDKLWSIFNSYKASL